MSSKSRYDKWYSKQRPEVKLKDFRLITHKEQIKETDFLIIIQTDLWDSVEEVDESKLNIFLYNNKKYCVNILKGMFSNFEKYRKQLAVNQFKDFEFVVMHHREGLPYLEIFSYPKLQDMIRECSVFTYPEKVEIQIDDKDIITHLDIKTSFERSFITV